MSYIYQVEVIEDGDPCVVEEDIKVACERLGYDAQVYDEGDGFFQIEAERRLNMKAVKADIEALDGASRCKITLELLQSP